jgi:GcrA cell cycle regulator
MTGSRSDWTPERDELLRKVMDSGLSFKDAAVEINAATGSTFSRNAAIGRGKRIGIVVPKRKSKVPKRLEPCNRAAPPRQIGQAKPRRLASDFSPLNIAPVASRRLVLIELEPKDCRYPDGDGPFTFCGHPRCDGRSYCAAHLRIVWKPKELRA